MVGGGIGREKAAAEGTFRNGVLGGISRNARQARAYVGKTKSCLLLCLCFFFPECESGGWSAKKWRLGGAT